jgi:hypothetical protein
MSILLLAFLCLHLLPRNALGFSTHNTTISRTFEALEAGIGEPIRVTVHFTNAEGIELANFFFSEKVPFGFTASPVHLKINGSDVSNYLFEPGLVGAVYPGHYMYRWVLETPGGSENNPVPPGATVEIAYSLRSSLPGVFHMNAFHWAGYYEQAPEEERAAFGHSEAEDDQGVTILGGASCAATAEASSSGSVQVVGTRGLAGHMFLLLLLPVCAGILVRVARAADAAGPTRPR